MKPTYRIVEVWWDDASVEARADTVDDLPDDVYACTVGYLRHETERSVQIAAEVFEDGSMRGITRIPKGMIKEIRDLRRVAPRSRARIGE